MSLDKLVLDGIAGIANMCHEMLHNKPEKYSKNERWLAVQYIHNLKDLLIAEKTGKPVEITSRFKTLLGYFSNCLIRYEMDANLKLNKICNHVSFGSIAAFGIGSFFNTPVSYALIGSGVSFFLISETLRHIISHNSNNLVDEANNNFEKIIKSDDNTWRKAVSRMCYNPKKYLLNYRWYE